MDQPGSVLVESVESLSDWLQSLNGHDVSKLAIIEVNMS